MFLVFLPKTVSIRKIKIYLGVLKEVLKKGYICVW
jgi:hypothetical protein